MVAARRQTEARKLRLESRAVAVEDDPGLRDVRAREAPGWRETPLGRRGVVRLGREEPVEALPEPGVRRLDQDRAAAGLERPFGLAQELARIGQVVEDVQHHDRRETRVGKVEPRSAHDAVEMRLGVQVRRDGLGHDLLQEAAARAELDDRARRDAAQMPRDLGVVLAVERAQEGLADDQVAMNADELGRVVVEPAHFGELQSSLEPRGGRPDHRACKCRARRRARHAVATYNPAS